MIFLVQFLADFVFVSELRGLEDTPEGSVGIVLEIRVVMTASHPGLDDSRLVTDNILFINRRHTRESFQKRDLALNQILDPDTFKL
jgi:hypothetical protein